MPGTFTLTTDEIAKRFNRLKGIAHPHIGLDGQNVRDHAYAKVSRCTTIRFIAAGAAQNGAVNTLGEIEEDGFITVFS